MKYHAKLFLGNNEVRYWSDFTKDGITDRLLIPFINGQVVYSKGMNGILNLRNVTKIQIYRTKDKLRKEGEKRAMQMREEDFEQYDCTKEILNEVKIKTSNVNATSLLQKSFLNQKNQVFVIMKFGSKLLDSAYEGVIKPIFEEFGIEVIRVDEIQDSGKISDQILTSIAESKYVYSDLSGERPNCYYETGFSHALGKEIILCIHKNDKIHFDLAGYRFIQWETEAELRRNLKRRLKTLIENEKD